MATVPILTIIKRVNTLLVDPTFTRWPKQELLDYYNDATKAIVLVRPDAHTKNVEFICVAGTKQALPADALRLIEVLRNANGKVIRFVPRKALDDSYPEWHSGKTATSVDNYCYEERDPKTFYVYPKAPATALYIELIISINPTQLASMASNIAYDDIYETVLIDYVLYRAYGKDSKHTSNMQRSAAHYQAFQNALGLKSRGEMMLSPVQQFGAGVPAQPSDGGTT